MSLVAARGQLEQLLDGLSQRISDFAASKQVLNVPAAYTQDDEFLLEGLLSRVWQSWSSFCRSCVVHSCLGSATSAGALVPSVAGAATEGHVSAAAIIARSGNAPNWLRTNAVLRFEPTWGDVDVLARIIPLLNPSNAAQLLAAFSSGHASAKALQTIRNSAAHDNHQTRADILALAASYVAFPIGHPTHALLWSDPTSADFLVLQAISDLKAAAAAAIS
jgi:hypothetical protein